MLRFGSIAVILMLAASPAAAQSLGVTEQDGAPAVEGQGSSDTGVGILSDNLSVGVGGDGALSAYSSSGRAAGSGSAQLEAGPAQVGAEGAGFEIAGPDGAVIPALDMDPDGNGTIDANEREAVRRFSVDQRDCDGVILSASSPEQVAAIAASSRISLVLVCADPSGLDQALRAAIAANPALMDRLAGAGYGLADVAGLELMPDGRGTIFVATF